MTTNLKTSERITRAYEAGLLHGSTDRYDARPYGLNFEAFNAYELGRKDGAELKRKCGDKGQLCPTCHEEF